MLADGVFSGGGIKLDRFAFSKIADYGGSLQSAQGSQR
jgi:hypothetical protein